MPKKRTRKQTEIPETLSKDLEQPVFDDEDRAADNEDPAAAILEPPEELQMIEEDFKKFSNTTKGPSNEKLKEGSQSPEKIEDMHRLAPDWAVKLAKIK